MVGQLASRPHDLVSGREVVPDRDAPVFAHLRSTMGLPDDVRWWPEGAGRVQPPHRAVTLVSGGVPVDADFEHPTVALLERVLAALRPSVAPAVPARLRPAGRHELAAG